VILGAQVLSVDDRRGRPPAVVRHRLRSDPTQAYFSFLPPNFEQGSEPVVLVHGISRNAREHILSFAPFAMRSGRALLAPVFSREFCRDFQQLGWSGAGRRSDLLLQNVLAEFASWNGTSADRFRLFGHSGGAQFAHRYALANPRHVARLALCAAGYWTFPTADQPFPLGLDCRSIPGGPGLDLASFLEVPTLVMVGTRDTRRDSNLRRDADLDHTQGRHRLARAARWVEAIGAAAMAAGRPGPRLALLTGAGHRFEDTVRHGLCEAAWPWLDATDEPAN
jgi:pimeloyl-ACP methyl ester carboxylesterase